MSQLTAEYFDQKLGEQTKYFEHRLDARADDIVQAMKAGFDEHTEQITELRQSINTLTNSVDQFVKMMQDVKQEMVVLRKQLNDIQQRVSELEARV